MSEKIGGAKGTELDDEFTEMEKVFKLVAVFLVDLAENVVFVFLSAQKSAILVLHVACKLLVM